MAAPPSPETLISKSPTPPPLCTTTSTSTDLSSSTPPPKSCSTSPPNPSSTPPPNSSSTPPPNSSSTPPPKSSTPDPNPSLTPTPSPNPNPNLSPAPITTNITPPLPQFPPSFRPVGAPPQFPTPPAPSSSSFPPHQNPTLQPPGVPPQTYYATPGQPPRPPYWKQPPPPQKPNGYVAAALPSQVPPAMIAPPGNFVFCGSRHEKASCTAADPAYSKLPDNFHENLLPSEKLTHNPTSAVHKVVHDLLQNGEVSQKYMQGSRSMKIDNWFLLDNFVPNDFSSSAARVKALKDHSKRSRSHMSMKQHKKLGSFYLSSDSQRHELFKPLHELWAGYIMKLLKETGKNQMPQRILAADLHGAILLVVRCRQQAALVGINGIMIRETAETFGVIAEDDKFRVVPKKGSVFIFKAGSFKITIIGDKFCRRDNGI